MKTTVLPFLLFSALGASSLTAGILYPSITMSPTVDALNDEIGNNYLWGQPADPNTILAGFTIDGTTYSWTNALPDGFLLEAGKSSLTVEKVFAEAGWPSEVMFGLDNALSWDGSAETALYSNKPVWEYKGVELTSSSVDTVYLSLLTDIRKLPDAAPHTALFGSTIGDYLHVYAADFNSPSKQGYVVFYDDQIDAVSDDNHDDFVLYLEYSVVPEPSVLLGAITTGVLGLLFLKRRRR